MSRHQSPLIDLTAQAEFIDGIELNMAFIEKNLEQLDYWSDLKFATSLVEYYKKFELLTEKQIPYATRFWQELNAKGCK